MLSYRIPLARVSILFMGVLCLVASTPGHSQKPRPERVVPASTEPTPFSTIATRTTPVYSVEFRPADQLTAQDRLLLADAESSIAEHAGFAGLEYQQSNWNYRQIVCPSFPNHLFLQYTRNNGAGDTTVFSASIPRHGEGRVRIVPILRRGYSLFSPAPINALTIAAFNHIRAEEGENANADWLGNALCYAALAGTQAQILPADAEPSVHKPIPALNAAMEVELQAHGMELVRFDDAASRPHAMEWTMTFTQQGKLIRATHRPASMSRASPVPQKSAVARTWPVPSSPRD